MNDPFDVLAQNCVLYEKTCVRINGGVFDSEFRSLIFDIFWVSDCIYAWNTIHKFLYINYEYVGLPFLFADLSDIWEGNIIL